MIKGFPHYAHLSKILVSEGQVVEKGQLISRVGSTGNSTAPHCHFEVPKKINSYNQYPIRLGRNYVINNYINPYVYLAQPGVVSPMAWTHTGNDWLTFIGNNTYHPGVDFNRYPQDFNDPVYAVVKAKVLYARFNSGWGNHIFLEPIVSEVSDRWFVDNFKRIWGVAPATGDWTYFKMRLQVGTLLSEDHVLDNMLFWYGVVYPWNKEKLKHEFSEEGNRRWQYEKEKVLG